MSENTTSKKESDYVARARRAWETRRANAAKKREKNAQVATSAVQKRRPGRVKEIAAPSSFIGSFEVTTSVYTAEQVRELNAAAVTTDGSSYRLLRRNGEIVPASYFA